MKTMSVTLFVCFFSVVSLFANVLDKESVKTLDAFAKAYQKLYPNLTTKQPVILLQIKNIDSIAKKNKIGETIKAYLENNIQHSFFFYLVDREDMKSILKEIELGQMGLVSEREAVKAGNLSGANLLITGNVTAIQNKFHITLKLIETETGKILETYAFNIKKDILVHASTELQYSYVTKHGIGMSINGFSYLTHTDLFNKYQPSLQDIQFHYRPSKVIMLSIGHLSTLLSTGENYRFDDFNPKYNNGQPPTSSLDIQPELPPYIKPDTKSSATKSSNNKPGQFTGSFDLNLSHIDAQYTINFSPKFNIGINVGFIFTSYNPIMTYEIGYPSGLFYRDIAAGTNATSTGTNFYDIPKLDNKPLTYLFKSGVGGKLEIKPEFFITPRIVIRASIGYLLFQKLKIREVHASHNEWSFYEEGQDSSTWEYDPNDVNKVNDNNPSASYMYYGFNPTKRPDGKRFELDLSGFYASIGASFFF